MSRTDILKECDNRLPNTEQGLFRKFDVRRVDGSDAPGGKHHGCEYFVLDVTHDQHAPDALLSYAESCKSTHPQLSADLIDRYSLRANTQESSAAQGAMGDEVARPDLIEKLTYHTHECDDLTLDEALDFLAQGWKKVHGRTERQMVFQIVRLLASQPLANTAQGKTEQPSQEKP